VPAEKAFYFYRDVGARTGAIAKSLGEFVNLAGSVELRSIEFHLSRGDFEKWIQMLGDETLARQLARLKLEKLSGDQLRKRLLQILRLRYGLLRKLASTSAG
jgi:hypothetical protein